jgi:ribosome-binding protein aMBF1 (putative translation factor)
MARRTRDAVEIMDHLILKNDRERLANVDRIYTDLLIAQAIYDLRTAAGLSQAELASRVGTQPSAICRLEDGAYQGHSFGMLRRIAGALGKRIEIRFVDLEAPGQGGVTEQEPALR